MMYKQACTVINKQKIKEEIDQSTQFSHNQIYKIKYT